LYDGNGFLAGAIDNIAEERSTTQPANNPLK
jgi:hypothetical protein